MNRTCLIEDEKLIECLKLSNDADSSSSIRSFISSQLKPNIKLTTRHGRLLTDAEAHTLSSLTNNTLISETDNYTLGSSCELVGQLLTGAFENGLMFVNRELDLARNCESFSFETLLVDILLERKGLKRVLVIDWDRLAPSRRIIQNKFYTDQRVLNISIRPKEEDEARQFDQIGAETGTGFNINIEIKNVIKLT